MYYLFIHSVDSKLDSSFQQQSMQGLSSKLGQLTLYCSTTRQYIEFTYTRILAPNCYLQDQYSLVSIKYIFMMQA
jgi:hypothetical protein